MVSAWGGTWEDGEKEWGVNVEDDCGCGGCCIGRVEEDEERVHAYEMLTLSEITSITSEIQNPYYQQEKSENGRAVWTTCMWMTDATGRGRA